MAGGKSLSKKSKESFFDKLKQALAVGKGLFRYMASISLMLYSLPVIRKVFPLWQ